MKKQFTFLKTFLVAVFLITASIVQVSAQVTLILPNASTANFSTIAAAYSAINFTTNPGAHVIQLESGYTGESSYPLTLGSVTGASATNTTTIRPAAGQTKTLSAATVSSSSLTTASAPNQFSGSLSTLASGYSVGGYGFTAVTTVSSISPNGVVTLGASLNSSANHNATWIADPTSVIKITSTGYDGTKKIYTVPNSTGVTAGMKVGGNGIPAGATVSSTTATTITISTAGSVAATDMYFGTIAVTPYAFQMSVTDASLVKVGDMITGTGVTEPSMITAIEGNVLTLDNKGYSYANGASVTTYTGGTVLLNGAKYVTFDGQAGGSGSTKNLTISNESTSPYAYAVKFVNDTYKNTIKYCNIKGSATSTTSAPIGGTVYIGGTSGTTARSGSSGSYLGSGNLYNTIDNCEISNADATEANLPSVGIFMKGSSPSTNEGNAITNCNIFNYFNVGAFISSGIYNDVYTNTTTISANKLYQTATRTFTGAGLHYPIYLNTSGVLSAVTDNTIGYNSNNNSGIYTINGNVAHRFAGIYINNYTGGQSPPVAGNTIASINYTTASAGNGAEGIVVGIFQKAGNGIGANSISTVNRPNIISNITLNYSGTLSGTFSLAGASYSYASGAHNYSYCKIYNLNAIPSSNTLVGKVMGIYTTASFGGSIKGNTIYNLSCGENANTAAHIVTGINSNSASTQTVERNIVYDLNAKSSGNSVITGIANSVGTYQTTIKNNIVRIGAEVTSDAIIYGLNYSMGVANGNVFNYHNTISISGTATKTGGPANSTFSIYLGGNNAATNHSIQNNIFTNQRINSESGSAKHFAFRFAYTVANTIKVLNYNLYWATPLGYFGGTGPTEYANLAAWKQSGGNTKILIANDDNSIEGNPNFVSSTDLHITTSSAPYNAGIDLSATVGDDFDGDKRLTGKKDIGADDISSLNTWTGTTSSDWDVTTNWSNAAKPTASNGSVVIPAGVTNIPVISATNAACNNITLQPGAQLTLNSSKTLAASGNLLLQSDASNGTATIKDLNTNGGITVTGTTSVQQYLTTGRNWYVSSPVATATSNVFSAASSTTNKLWYYNEPTGTSAPWTQITDSITSLTVGKGYVVNMPADGVVTFTGALNTGNLSSPVLTRTTGQAKEGFNLVGNPYPSYLDWHSATKSHVGNTLWYRTKVSGSHKFFTYLQGDGAREVGSVSVPADVTNLIPPMQAFWVRLDEGQTAGSVTFTNAMRSHKESDKPTNKLRTKSENNSLNQLIRLQVSNGINDDEAVVYFNPNVSDGFDRYDAPKMSNANPAIPEIFTKAGNQQLVINGLSSIEANSIVPVGFVAGNASTFSLKATEITNLPTDVKVILKDNATLAETELTANAVYEFAPASVSGDRFSLIFRTTGATTGLNSAKAIVNVYVNGDNRIVISAPEKSVYSIYNAMGQMIENGMLNSTLQTANCKLQTGIFVVKVGNQSTRVIIK